MDSLKNIEKLQDAIATVFCSWEEIAMSNKSFDVKIFVDKDKNSYLLQHIGITKERYDSSTLAHLEIREGKIWILTDNTEQGIATELVALGIPKSQIVLAFYPPSVRERGEFAVA
jgi:RimJ/RimL family protein N-acetyltransferase